MVHYQKLRLISVLLGVVTGRDVFSLHSPSARSMVSSRTLMTPLKNPKIEIFYSNYLQEHYIIKKDLARRRETPAGK